MWFSWVCLCLLLPCVLSRSLQAASFNSSTLGQLQSLQQLTKEIEAQGNYNLLSALEASPVKTEELSLYIFTRSNPDGTQLSWAHAHKIGELSSFNPEHKTFIYIHGWIDTVESEGSVLVRTALLEAGDLNVLVLDWDECAGHINYLASWGCVEGVGNYLGDALKTIFKTYNYSPDDVTIVGHSLGAHIAGYAGKRTGKSIGAIVGLDPAGPLFLRLLKSNRLAENDAKHVQVIHTASNFLGVNYNLGRADFWPNGGEKQAGCGSDPIGDCSHARAFQYYAESVVRNDFAGRQCGSYDSFEDGSCNKNALGRMGGLELDVSLQGDYYLKTKEALPYGNE